MKKEIPLSSPASQADLHVDTILLESSQVIRNQRGYVLPIQITVQNIGTAIAQNAIFVVTGNGQMLDASDEVTLEPGQSHTLQGEWNLNALLQANPRGIANLELEVVADPENQIEELPIGLNEQTETMTADARPRITLVRKEFAEGVFLDDVPLSNEVEVFVDWNGNLDGVSFTSADLPKVSFQVNGTEKTPRGGFVSANEKCADGLCNGHGQ